MGVEYFRYNADGGYLTEEPCSYAEALQSANRLRRLIDTLDRRRAALRLEIEKNQITDAPTVEERI